YRNGGWCLCPSVRCISCRAITRIADSSCKNAVSFSSARTPNRFPSPRCASTIQIVRPSWLKRPCQFAVFSDKLPSMEAEIDCSLQQAQFTSRKPRIGKPFRTWTPNINKKGIKVKRSLITMAVVLSIVSLSLDGSPAFGGDRGHARGGSGGGRGHGGGGRVSSGFSGGRHF